MELTNRKGYQPLATASQDSLSTVTADTAYVVEVPKKKDHDAVLKTLLGAFSKRGLLVEQFEDSKHTVLYITTSREQFEWEADQEIERQNLKDFFLMVKGKEYGLQRAKTKAQLDKLAPELKERLLRHMLDSIEVDKTFYDEYDLNNFHPQMPLLERLQHKELVEVVAPLHDKEARNPLKKKTFFSLTAPVHEVFEYFGARAAMYFGFLGCYIKWLYVPAVLGGLAHVMEVRAGTVDNIWVVLYSIFMIFWSGLFLKGWERESCQLAFDWGVAKDDIPEESIRPTFVGVLRESPITGKKELHFSSKTRMMRSLACIPICLSFLVFALMVMIMGLNLNGYIHKDSPIYVPLLNSRFPDTPGMTSPDDPMIIQFLPTIIHSVAILTLNMIYSQMAYRLTEWENFRTEEEFERALILKRVPFEMFDCYLSLFYLAFYDGDMTKLRSELMGLFMADTGRRVAVESIIPWIQKQIGAKMDTKFGTKENRHKRQTLKELRMQRVEEFDDYIEMVTQFGYITLFAAAFPLASTLALVANIVEVRSDILKCLYLYQRGPSTKADGIGPWLPILRMISQMSVLTNCAIFGYTSNQLETLLIGDHAKTIFGGHRATSIALIFLFEHIIFILKNSIEMAIPPVPGSVNTMLKKRAYVREQALQRYNTEMLQAGGRQHNRPDTAAVGVEEKKEK